jgi:starch synthase
MDILVASSEVVPFAKTGGLADVCGALPRELSKLGHRVTVFLPAYRCIRAAGIPIQETGIRLEIPIGAKIVDGNLLRTHLPASEVIVYFVNQPGYFDRDQLYGKSGTDYADNCERFVFFCRSVLESVRLLGLHLDLVHAHDWQTGLIPALLNTEFSGASDYENIASLFTIHNLAYQGNFWHWDMLLTGLDWKYFNWREMECYGNLNLLKTGIAFADAISTVSPTYAHEIQTPEHGCGLEGILQYRSEQLTGILNGIDADDWNPRTDRFLVANYSSEDFEAGKAACKLALQQESSLEVRPEVPLIGVVGRLETQKGWSLILPVMKKWLETMDVQWVVLGTGQPEYHSALTSLSRLHSEKLALTLGFSNELAHRIESAADIFLMPSQFEPCGLNQMYSMAYGTIPVVRRTGGLADTVIDATTANRQSKTATGFSFEPFAVEALEATLLRAVSMYRDHRPEWNQLIQTGMKTDWSWSTSARKYVDLYKKTAALKLESHQAV